MLGNTLDDESQISFRIKAVELGRADQTVDAGSTFAPGIGTGKQEVLPSQGDRAQRPFRRIIVDLDQSIARVPDKRCL